MINNDNDLKKFEGFALDGEKKVLWYEDELVELPVKAVELLNVLIENRGEVVSKDELLDKVWQDSFVEESVLPQNVYLLRKQFKEKGLDSNLIQTVPRRGYRFTGELIESVDEEISFEHSIYERKFVVEADVDDENLAEVFQTRVNNSNIKVRENQVTQIPKSSAITSRNILLISIIAFLSCALIGSTFWILKNSNSDPNDKNKVRPELTKFTRLTESGKEFYPAISRDSKNIAYVLIEGDKYGIVLQHIETKSETVVVELQEHGLRSIQFSADGSHLYYMAREPKYLESTIYQIPIYGGNKRKILSNVRHQFSISTNGKKFAFYRFDPKKDETHLMTSNIDGSDEKVIATRSDPKKFKVWNVFPAWSYDDKKLVVSGNTEVPNKKEDERASYFLIVDIETGEEEEVKSPDWFSAFQAFWAKNGKGFFVSAQETRNSPRQLWYLEYPSGIASKITNDTNHYVDFRQSFETGDLLVMIKRSPANLYLIDLQNPDQIRQLTNTTTVINGRDGLVWTKDSKEIIFVKTKGIADGHLWKINIETGKTQQLTFDKDKSINTLELMPDGNSLLFGSNRTGNWHIWQIDIDGSNLKQITEGVGEGVPEVSSDGKWFFYSSPGVASDEIRKMPLAGGDSIKIGDNLIADGKKLDVGNNLGGTNKVSPTDPNQIISYYYDPNEAKKDPWKWVLFNHEEESELETLNFLTNNHAFEWSMDGKGIFYPKSSKGANNIFFHSVEDNKSKQITSFKNKRFVNLNISPDGKTLVASSENVTSNILMLSGF